ncbi:hypothetical protein DL98DRAFT_521909 [Cadophora sp. DSE1049]|nr:hypothetical protein DL98DRAFT_521909 [Cadophora sp. DSE1049]
MTFATLRHMPYTKCPIVRVHLLQYRPRRRDPPPLFSAALAAASYTITSHLVAWYIWQRFEP